MKKDKVLIVIAIAGMVLSIFGGLTYAFFTAGVEGNNEAKGATAKTGTMSLEFDGTNIVSMEDALPGAIHEINFSVENTGTLPTSYGLDMINVNNSFKNDELVYKISSNNNGGKVENWSVLPNAVSTNLIPVITIEPGATQEYTMIIHFKETGSNQNANQGAEFSGVIQINNLQSTNFLTSRIIAGSDLYDEPDFTVRTNKAGIYKALDDDGMSYYYHGNATNNYIDLGTTYQESFSRFTVGINGKRAIRIIESYDTYDQTYDECVKRYTNYGYKTQEDCILDIQDYSKNKGDKLLWRIVRINGDGSIRLITDDVLSSTKVSFNEYTNDTYQAKLTGYTYLDDEGNTIDSNVKQYLDNYYNTVLLPLNDKLVESSYCNDTTSDNYFTNTNSNLIYYGAFSRLFNAIPTLKCPATPENYGGKYNLKIGLLTADEANMAGILDMEYDYRFKTSYLWNPTTWLTMSPYTSASKYQTISVVSVEGVIDSFAEAAIKPVINLKKDIIVTEGDGTVNTPYKVS